MSVYNNGIQVDSLGIAKENAPQTDSSFPANGEQASVATEGTSSLDTPAVQTSVA